MHQCGGPGGAHFPTARGARQPRRDAVQERTQECVTGVLTESVHQCGGPGGASVAKGSRRKATTPEGCSLERTHDCKSWVLTAVSPCWEGPAEAAQCLNIGVMAAIMVVCKLPRHAVPRRQPRRAAIQEQTQECMTAAKARCAKAATPEGCDSRADSRMHD